MLTGPFQVNKLQIAMGERVRMYLGHTHAASFFNRLIVRDGLSNHGSARRSVLALIKDRMASFDAVSDEVYAVIIPTQLTS